MAAIKHVGSLLLIEQDDRIQIYGEHQVGNYITVWKPGSDAENPDGFSTITWHSNQMANVELTQEMICMLSLATNIAVDMNKSWADKLAEKAREEERLARREMKKG